MAGNIPGTIYAGVTLSISITLTAYRAPEWSLALYLRGPAQIDLTSTASGSSHLIAADAAMTSSWAPGAYWWSLRAVQGAEVALVDEGQLTLEADLSVIASGHDGRSHAERVLVAIEAVIEGRATKDQQAYQINGRSITRMTVADLLLLRSRYRDEVRRQKAARHGQSLLGRQILARF
ncbi:hypothetical protein [Pararhodobacter zhoushanensis]|uniref:hypothetical protein n=1 Tax=Pararhodobacter zhoushanensis TaxID=2479545 RepID=UPI000F8EE1FE|nr:hypothetical protein [Pararhodobacter zhoushanensis]